MIERKLLTREQLYGAITSAEQLGCDYDVRRRIEVNGKHRLPRWTITIYNDAPADEAIDVDESDG